MTIVAGRLSAAAARTESMSAWEVRGGLQAFVRGPVTYNIAPAADVGSHASFGLGRFDLALLP